MRRVPTAMWIVAILAAGVAAHFAGLQGEFILDDVGEILENPRLRRIAAGSVLPSLHTRSLVTLTFALNILLGGYEPVGFHIVNLAIHLVGGLVLFSLVRYTLLLSGMPAWTRERACEIAAGTACLWVVHPLTTSAVTYISQRYEITMALFAMCVLLFLARGATAERKGIRVAWLSLGVLSCFLGMMTKEVMIVVPVLAIAYDRTFLSDSWRELIRERHAYYLALLASWGWLAFLAVRSSPGMHVNPDFEGGPSVWYLLTQCGVILHYLRLAFWPDRLRLDLAWPIVSKWMDALPEFLAVTGLGLLTVFLLWRRPRVGFLGVCFFVLLAPTSSLVPRPDAVFEHRVYLPLAAVVCGVAVGLAAVVAWIESCHAGAGRCAHRFAVVVAIVAVASLAFRSYRRNLEFADPAEMWRQIAVEQPQNFRAQSFLVSDLLRRDLPREAEARARGLLEQILAATARRDPEGVRIRAASSYMVSLAWNHLGGALYQQGRMGEAGDAFRQAIDARPGFVDARYNLALTLMAAGHLDGAAEELRKVVRSAPHHRAATEALRVLEDQRGKGETP